MRLWSIHPEFLDDKGLVACWREALLAQAVLLNKTNGYKNHSQLIRFKNTESPIEFIGSFLKTIFEEAEKRKFKFNKEKIEKYNNLKINVTDKQLQFEFLHLQKKLDVRNKIKFIENITMEIKPNKLFNVIEGDIEEWEIV
jgi:hypothetical protein